VKTILLTGIAVLFLATGAAHAAATKFQQHTVKGIHYKPGIITQRKAGGVQQRPVIREGGKTVGARTVSSGKHLNEGVINMRKSGGDPKLGGRVR
jgi:hypothetical protein